MTLVVALLPLRSLRLLLGRLPGKRTFVPLLGCSDGLLENQLANPHSCIENYRIRPKIEHLELDFAFKSGVNCWCGNVDPDTEAGETALSFDSRRKPRIDWDRYTLGGPGQHKLTGAQRVLVCAYSPLKFLG